LAAVSWKIFKKAKDGEAPQVLRTRRHTSVERVGMAANPTLQYGTLELLLRSLLSYDFQSETGSYVVTTDY